MGRKTYDKVLRVSANTPHTDKKSYVLSQNPHLRRSSKHVEFIYADVIVFIKKHLIQSKGKDIWLVGGFRYYFHFFKCKSSG